MKRSAVILACLLLLGCGGGGGGSDSTDSAVVAPTPQAATRQITPSFSDDAARLDVAQSITSVLSPAASGAPSAAITVLNAGQSDNLLFATNADGEVILIGSDVDSGGLGVASSAANLAWLGLLIADNPANLPLDAMRPLLSAASGYGALVDAVRSALTAGTPLSQSTAVAQAVADVVVQTQLAYAASQQQASAATSQRRAQEASALSGDQFLIREADHERVWASLVDGQLVMHNRTALVWQAAITDALNDFNLTGDTGVVLPPARNTAITLIQGHAGSETRTVVPGAAYSRITLRQSAQTQRTNADEMIALGSAAVTRVATLALRGLGIDASACTQAWAEAVRNTSGYAAFLAAPSPQAFHELLRQGESVSLLQRLPACAPLTQAVAQEAWLRAAIGLMGSLRATQRNDAAYAKLYQLTQYREHASSIEVCLYDGALSPCIQQLTATNGALTVKVDDVITLPVQAYTRDEQPLPLHSRIQVSVMNQGVATVSPLDSEGRLTLTAKASGSTLITVTDPVTGVALAEPINLTVNPKTGYWRLHYSADATCNDQLPTGGEWRFNHPCYALYPFVTTSESPYIIFMDGQDVATFGAFNVQTTLPVSYSSQADTFAYSTPTGYAHDLSDQETYRLEGTIRYTFTVTSRSNVQLRGTYVASFPSAYIVNGVLNKASDYRFVASEITGTWEANFQEGTYVPPQLNGYAYCATGAFRKNYGIREASLNDTGCDPIYIPGGKCEPAQPENSCVFGRAL